MAKGVDFPQSNLTLQGSEEDRAAGNVYDLFAYRFRDLDNVANIITCWELSDDEIAEIVRTRRVWCRALGHTQPPMCIQGDSPFED